MKKLHMHIFCFQNLSIYKKKLHMQIFCFRNLSIYKKYFPLRIYAITDLFADKSDFGVGVPDLVSLVQNDVVPLTREEMVAIDPHPSIRRYQDTTTFGNSGGLVHRL